MADFWDIPSVVHKDALERGWDFRINELDDSLEIKDPELNDWTLMTDHNFNRFTVEMRGLGYGRKTDAGKPGLTAMKESLSVIGWQNRYNPILDFFRTVKGEYTPRPHPDNLAGYRTWAIPEIGKYFSNPDTMFELWLFRWMVGAIAKAFQGARNPMLVLEGPQRVGKSEFAKWLSAPVGHFVRGDIQPDNKDHKVRLVNTFLWEADELGRITTKKNRDSLKSFLTLDEIFERLPYTAKPTRKPVMCSFIGTFNFDGAGLLTDPTGSTRFLITEITAIDWQGYTKAIDPRQLWAEASWWYHQYAPHRPWELTAEERAKQREINSRYERHSALEDVLMNYFHIDPDNTNWFETSVVIRNVISDSYKISTEQGLYNELGSVMKSLGCAPGRVDNQRGYYGLAPK